MVARDADRLLPRAADDPNIVLVVALGRAVGLLAVGGDGGFSLICGS